MTFKYSERINQTSHIYRTVAKPLLQLGTDQEVTTLSELFLTSCDRYKSRICLGSRELIGTIRDSQGRTKLIQGNYQWLTYNQAYLEAADFALGLKATCEVNPGDRVAIYAETKREWLLACQGCFLQNLTVVTCYASLGEEALLHCLQETEVRVVMADSRLVRRLLPLTPKLPHLKYVILLDGSSTEEFCVGKISLIEYNDVLNNALQRPRVYQVPTPTDTAFIMYTSGSTGIPKGIAGYINPDTIVDGNMDYDFYLGTCTTGGVCTPDAGIGTTISVIISGSINSVPLTSAKTFDY